MWRRHLLIYLLYLLSGAAALVYEISWSRQTGLMFGHTSQSASLVLAAYFAGMAAGYLLGSKFPQKWPPLLGYGIAEIVAGLWALAAPQIGDWFSRTEFTAQWLHADGLVGAAIRAVFCFAFLLPATIALGATLPLVARALQGSGDRNTRLTIAYSLNTLGAFIGVVAATFFLLILCGVRGSSYLAAAVSIVCGGVACVASRWESALEQSAHEQSAHEQDTLPPQPVAGGAEALQPPQQRFPQAASWMVVAVVSGWFTLGLEVLNTRMFSLIFHNSTYTFGAVVAVFLAGLALGARLTPFLCKWFKPRTVAVGASVGGGLLVAFSTSVFLQLTGLEYFTYGDGFAGYITGALALVAAVTLAPATLLGMILPAAFLAAPAQEASQWSGRLAAANTIAAACGAAAASFLLVPAMGLWFSLAAVAGAFALMPLAFLPRGRAMVVQLAAAAVVIACAWGFAVSARQQSVQVADNETLLRRWETSYGWIDVIRIESNGSLEVSQNLHYRFGGTGPERRRELRQGHIPLLLHPQPRQVVFLGLGTGVTPSAALYHEEVQQTDIAELIPGAVEAARFIGDGNSHVVDDPRVQMHENDARHYLSRTSKQFDVIVSDLFVPWESRTGYLYTVEHYQMARRKLLPGGLFCQWLALYQTGGREFEAIANSLRKVFPHVTLWWGRMNVRRPMLALIGSDQPLTVDAENLQRRLNALSGKANPPDVSLQSSSNLLSLYAGDWPTVNGATLNTDEFPVVEFGNPVSHRNHQLLSRNTFRRYWREEIADLQRNALQVQHADKQLTESLQHAAAWHRTVLSDE